MLRKKGEPGPDRRYKSASSAESVAGDADAVDLADDYVGRNNKKGQRKAVRLDEVGPRMELRLIKTSEDVPGKEGAVMYHEFGMLSLVLCLSKSLMFLFSQKIKEGSRGAKKPSMPRRESSRHTRIPQHSNTQS
jgi:ribosome biogenesis protein SSF1/2